MAQAEPNLTTRRGFSKWLAAAGAVAVVPTAVKAVETIRPELQAATKAVEAKWAEVVVAQEKVDRANAAIEAWRVRNPRPDGSDSTYDDDESSARLNRDWGKWCQREAAAMLKAGIYRCGKRRLELTAELNGALRAVANISAANMAEVIFKARFTNESDHDGIVAYAIVDDLLTLHEQPNI